MSPYRQLLLTLPVAAACIFACSSQPGEPPGKQAGPSGGNGSGNGSGNGTIGDAAAGAPTGSANGGGLGGLGGLGAAATRGGNRDGGLTADAACGATVLEPEPIETEETIEEKIDCTAEAPSPVSLYIMLDNSRSMNDNDKWAQAVQAISDFVQTQPSTGSGWTCVDQDGNDVPPPDDLAPPGAGSISVAIQYFHPIGSGGGGGGWTGGVNECDGVAHGTPAVPMGPIPDNAGAIITSLGQTGPNGNTPTVGALTGGTQYCAGYQQDNPDRQCVVVLVTDGQPNGCGLDGSNNNVDPNSAGMLTPIAQQAFDNNGVLTFTVGMDGVSADGFDLLDAIAVAGGSDCTPNEAGNEACDVSSGGGQSLLDALNTIRETVQVTDTSSQSVTTTQTQTSTLPCEWSIPSPPDGEEFDKDLVNVTITTSGEANELGNVATEADCTAAGGGWYYDDPDAPTRIVACPQTCDVVETLTEARVQILFGCAIQPAKFQ